MSKDYITAIVKAKEEWEKRNDHPFPMHVCTYAQHLSIASRDLLEDQIPLKQSASYRRYKGIRQTTGRKRLIQIAALCLSALEHGKPTPKRLRKAK